MNCEQATPRMPLSRPLTETIVDESLDALRAAALALVSLWARRAAPITEDGYDSIADLNEHTLKDIGAPDWLVARAAEQREAQRLRWLEFEIR